jgi:hypothetical protein
MSLAAAGAAMRDLGDSAAMAPECLAECARERKPKNLTSQAAPRY